MYQEIFMKKAIELSAEALSKPGTEPFGAVIVKCGVIVGQGLNHSVAHFDPTSHGEVEAIRDACRRLQCVDLSECEIYTSCEPCALCVAAMAIAGIKQMYYAASLLQAGQAFADLIPAERHSIDMDSLRIEAGSTVDKRATATTQKLDGEAATILAEWASRRKEASVGRK
jgi:guanine deaminase